MAGGAAGFFVRWRRAAGIGPLRVKEQSREAVSRAWDGAGAGAGAGKPLDGARRGSLMAKGEGAGTEGMKLAMAASRGSLLEVWWWW